MIFWEVHFLNSIFIYLIPIIIVLYLIGVYYFSRKYTLKLDIVDDLKKVWFSNNLFYLKIIIISLILSLFLVLLANPQKVNIDQNIKKNWIDIVLVMDVSKSMDASDLKPSRISKAKEAIKNFINTQKTNRLWLVVFSWKPITSTPLTFDYNILIESIENIDTDTIDSSVRQLSWTAIWDALLMTNNLFKNQQDQTQESREKAIILLTDWDANVWVDPIVVSKLLKENNIKVYSIWIWSENWWTVELWNSFFQRQVHVPPLNSESLKEISSITDWYFFRAYDNETMDKIFNKLEELEKNDIEVKQIKNMSDYYYPFINILIILMLVLSFLELRRVK